jgi:hypothetical protein
VRLSRSMRTRRARLTPALALALAVTALLLFAWPLARQPPLHLLPAFLHVLAVWAVIVVALWWVSRLPLGARPGPEERDD